MEDITIINSDKPVEEKTPANTPEPEDSFEDVSIESRNLLLTPTFADHDLDFIFDIYPHPELNAELGGR